MNNTAEMITIAQAEKLTGLARSTLVRFAEAGYFATAANERGEQLVELVELCKLFNIDQPANSDTNTDHLKYSVNEPLQQVPGIGRTSADFAGGTFVATSIKQSSKILNLSKSEPITNLASTPVLETIPEAVSDAAPNELPKADVPISSTVIPTPDAQIEHSNEIHREIRRLQNIIRGQEHEILKFQKVVELQEQLLETREAELRDNKKQRKWLQGRLEKQDIKSERDQLLLISEMQMLTKMYVQQSQKKSLVLQTLEWLGFRDPEVNETTRIGKAKLIVEEPTKN